MKDPRAPEGFSFAERRTWRTVIFTNVIAAMKQVITAMEDFEIDLEHDNNLPYCDYVFEEKEIKDTESFPRSYLQPLQALWLDSGVQMAVRRGNEYALYDNIH
jgi:guanine nucleotide-binding protein subunit alpha